jgi:hypothetical protein
MNLDSSDCCGQSRRDFLKTTRSRRRVCLRWRANYWRASAASVAPTASETLVTTLYKSLREEQRKALCFPFDNLLRTEVDNNWHITDQHISPFSTRTRTKW